MRCQMSSPTLLPSFGAQRLARRPGNGIWHSASWSRCRRLNTASCHRLGWRSQRGRWSHLGPDLSWMILLARPALLDATADVGRGWQSGRHYAALLCNEHLAAHTCHPTCILQGAVLRGLQRRVASPSVCSNSVWHSLPPALEGRLLARIMHAQNTCVESLCSRGQIAQAIAHAASGANGSMPFHALVGIAWSQSTSHGCLLWHMQTWRPSAHKVGQLAP